MSDLHVEAVVTENPFGVKGSISVGESVFGLDRDEFTQGAMKEIEALGHQLYQIAVDEYDRRNARPE